MFPYTPAHGSRLVLHISVLEHEYSVRVLSSPGETSLSDQPDAAYPLVVLHDVLSLAEQPVFHEQVGQMLFESLFTRGIGAAYRAARQAAAGRGERLTLELHFERSALAMTRYPWELLHDGTHFLLMNGAVNLVRSLPFPSPLVADPVPGPLDVLVVEAQPDDHPPVAGAYEGLAAALGSHMRADKLDLAYLMPPAWDSLMDWLLAGAPQILHIAGYSDVAGGGWLILADDHNASDRVPALVFGQALYNTQLKLLILSASPIEHEAETAVWGTVAPGLILGGVPAVAALQASIPAAEGLRFVRGLYRALLAGNDLETALLAGRQELSRTPYWHGPVLYHRAEPVATGGPVALPCRVDVVAPQAAVVHMPLRLGVWLRAAASASPPDSVVKRLIGYPLQTEGVLPTVDHDVTRSGVLHPGMAHIQVMVEQGEVHGPAVKSVPVGSGVVVPPVWFPLTPRATGEIRVRVEVRQDARVLATGTHHVQVTDQPVADTAAVLTVAQFVPDRSDSRASGEFRAVSTSHAQAPPATPEGTPWQEQGPAGGTPTTAAEPRQPVREPVHHSRTGRRESMQDRQAADGAQSWAEVSERLFDEALDGVLDWLQAGEEPPPEETDPLISGEYVPHVRDAVDESPLVGHVLEKSEPLTLNQPVSSLDTLPTVVDVLPDEPTMLLDRADVGLTPAPLDSDVSPVASPGDLPAGVPPDEIVAASPGDTGESAGADDIPPLDDNTAFGA